jgi:hypothetical protein
VFLTSRDIDVAAQLHVGLGETFTLIRGDDGAAVESADGSEAA